MSHVAAERRSKTQSIPIVRRADGTVRQVVVIEDGVQTFAGYYPPGVLRWEAGEPLNYEHRRYHWADAFSDDELRDGYGYEPVQVSILRLMAQVANEAEILTHREG